MASTRMFSSAGRIASGAALVVATLAAALVLAPAVLGWERYAIVSGSMSGTYDQGSLVLAEVVSVADLKVGDVITYTPPRGSGPDGLVTHRIASIGRDERGGRVFRTKGDANPVADPCPSASTAQRRRACATASPTPATRSPRSGGATCGWP